MIKPYKILYLEMHVSSEHKIHIFIDSVYIEIDRQASFGFKFNFNWGK